MAAARVLSWVAKKVERAEKMAVLKVELLVA